VTFEIRPAEPGDAARLVELAREVGAESEGWLIAGGEWRTAGEERRYLRSLRRHRHAAVFVAEIDGTIVGRLSIARDHRRLGAGTALMEGAERWARGVGVRKIELHVFPHNGPAIALYEGLGYEQEGFRHGHYRRGNDFVDAILMAKRLA